MSIQYHTPDVSASVVNEPLVFQRMLYSTMLCKGAIQTSSRVTRGSTANRARVRLVSQPARPVYCSTKTSHRVGAKAAPTHSMLSQNCATDKLGLTSSRA